MRLHQWSHFHSPWQSPYGLLLTVCLLIPVGIAVMVFPELIKL